MILSGFLMAYHYILRSEREPWTKPSTWTTFYIRRYFRLSPLYYLLLLPAYLLYAQYDRWKEAVHQLVDAAQRMPPDPAVTWQHVALHLSYLFGLFPTYHASLIIPDWSLSLEMQFYLVFPFLMLFILRFGWLAFAVAGSAIWLAATSHALGLAQRFVQPAPLVLSLMWFVVGMLWASAYLEKNAVVARNRVLLACGLSLLSLDLHDIILVFVFAWVIFASGRLSLGGTLAYTRRALSNKFSSFLADASYSVYLTHLLILTPVAYLLCTHTHFGSMLRFLIAATLTIAISYGLARPLEVLENAGIQLGKRLTGKSSQPPKPTAAQVELSA
jgi:peptidoglycan/LPS O-acetylase OafA/YrhL